MITKMTKYSFIMLSDETGNFLTRLQDLGVVDITRARKPVDTTSSAMLEKAGEIKKAISLLGKIDYTKDDDSEAILKRAESVTVPADVASAAVDTVTEMEKLRMRQDQASRETGERLPWGDFNPADIKKLEDNGYTIRWYKVPVKKFREEWAEEYALQVIENDGSYVWFVTVSETGTEYTFPVQETTAPGGNWKESQAEAERIEDEIISAKALLLKMKGYIPELKEAYARELSDLDLYLAGASKETAAENMVTVFTGFAPSEDDERLQAEFDSMDMAYVKESAVEEDNPPIKLKNNWFTRQFEVLTGMYGMPVYSEFDPTPILGPFFLLFFALCMGDAGYGILLILIGQFLKKTKGSMARLSSLVTILGVGCIFIGIVLGLALGSIPFSVPGVSMPVKLGLAGGPIVVGILIGAYGPRLHMVTYTTNSANLMLRALGLSIYLASLGLESGAGFAETVMSPQGAAWVGIGALITILPVAVMSVVCVRFSNTDYYSTAGILCGAMANPMALNYVNDSLPGNDASVSYATVYPLGMFLRVVISQVVLMLFL